MFSLGDKAFYPAHGVGVIEKIENRGVAVNSTENCYVLRIMDTGLTVRVPCSQVGAVGLRHLVSRDTAEKVFTVLRKKEDRALRPHLPWNRRHRDYLAKLKTGSILDLAEILKELSTLQGKKQLSFGEKKLMETVKKLLIKELACCHNCSEDTICGKINSLLAS